MLLDDDYDGYNGEPMEGVVSEDMVDAGIGLCASYDVPLEIWNDCVPSKVITQIRNWKAETSKYPVHPLTVLWGNVGAPGARRASFVTRALPVDCCR